MVLDGRVREIDRLGDNAADEAADFGRRRVGNAVIDARRNLSGVCGRWYSVIRRRLNLSIFGHGVQFQCRLFRLVQALTFGAPVVSLVQ